MPIVVGVLGTVPKCMVETLEEGWRCIYIYIYIYVRICVCVCLWEAATKIDFSLEVFDGKLITYLIFSTSKNHSKTFVQVTLKELFFAKSLK